MQGKAIEEMHKLTQIVSGFSKEVQVIQKISIYSKEIIVSEVLEAELIKLFQIWRYVNFAISNQFI